MKRQFKPFAEFKAVDGGPGGFEGYGSLWGILDSQNDIVERGAFKNTLPTFVRDGFIADGHNWDSVADGAIGTVEDAYEDEKGLFIKVAYHSTQRAQDARRIAMERLARGKSVGLSIGYAVRPGGDTMDSAGVRRLHDLDLFEVSHVNVPALRPAGVTSAKSGAGRRPDPALLALRGRFYTSHQADRVERAGLQAIKARHEARRAHERAALAELRANTLRTLVRVGGRGR